MPLVPSAVMAPQALRERAATAVVAAVRVLRWVRGDIGGSFGGSAVLGDRGAGGAGGAACERFAVRPVAWGGLVSVSARWRGWGPGRVRVLGLALPGAGPRATGGGGGWWRACGGPGAGPGAGLPDWFLGLG
ncbi:hypothetical protein Sdia_59830 [Streptomyces diastaticus subsp. diastaticus]|uniref:Uncharacterized protein n=1 Tax=Streptomyces diastaticus subsp. diastaticus TaxID=68040 RepID=A0ABQ1CYL4_STRDI|nr:hypothetical protein Sdia_59830 [Streptomyces diastaticus subsp. diastaticus]GGU44210.1 hypothetical protein GCM10015534_53380 [Streptomyces diastaticus subsp. diastaticus]